MTDSRVAAAASLVFILGGQSLVAQAPFQHQEYSLVCSAPVVGVVDRPSVIHGLKWRARHMGSGGTLVDSVQEVLFTFHNNELYQMVVSYDRGRTAGLSNDDVVDTFSAIYGVPLVRNARTARNGLSPDIGPGMTLLGQWEDARWLLTLQRNTYSAQYQLLVVSKALNRLQCGAGGRAHLDDRHAADQLGQPLLQLSRS